jgi:iron complex outermembrane receptor protein
LVRLAGRRELNGGAGFVDLSDTASGAARSGTTTERKNAFLKWVQTVGANTVITAAAVLNHCYGHTPYGTALAGITAHGDGDALNGDADSQDFTGYNTDVYNTDFEYGRSRGGVRFFR